MDDIGGMIPSKAKAETETETQLSTSEEAVMLHQEIRSPIRRHHSGKSHSSISSSSLSLRSNSDHLQFEVENHASGRSNWNEYWHKFNWNSFFRSPSIAPPNPELPVNQPAPIRSALEIAKSFFHVAAPFFRGNAKWKAWGLSIVMIILCASCTGLYVVLSYNQSDFFTALAHKDKEKFFKAIWQFVGITVVAAPLFSIYDYIQGLLMLEWRLWMTELLLSHYFANRSFFEMKMHYKIDNPDQRICQDVDSFVSTTVVLITVIVENLLNIFAFSQVLWSISHQLIFFLWFYAALGTIVTVKIFGKKLMSLQFEGLQREADLRYALVRVRENAESIAFYRGEDKEFSSTKGFLSRLVLNIRSRLVWSFNLSIFNYAYKYATILIPSLIICPRYFAGEVEMGVINQADFAFDKILKALTFIVSKMDSLSGLAAQIERLEGLLVAFGSPRSAFLGSNPDQSPPTKKFDDSKNEKADKSDVSEKATIESIPLLPLSFQAPSSSVNEGVSVKISQTPDVSRVELLEGSHLEVRDLTVFIPNSDQILYAQKLTFKLQEGQSLLIMGPSGCGKSSLLRAIAGLWTVGSGQIWSPKNSLFLPQKPYMPLGSLRTQLLFPSEASTHGSVDDSELLQTLDDVALGGLAEKLGGLDAIMDWSDVLSVGEQQRIAFARLLIHKPKLAFLDEATSALDSKNEARLYNLLKRKVESCVSVGHRTSLLQFHHVLLACEDDAWELTRIGATF